METRINASTCSNEKTCFVNLQSICDVAHRDDTTWNKQYKSILELFLNNNTSLNDFIYLLTNRKEYSMPSERGDDLIYKRSPFYKVEEQHICDIPAPAPKHAKMDYSKYQVRCVAKFALSVKEVNELIDRASMKVTSEWLGKHHYNPALTEKQQAPAKSQLKEKCLLINLEIFDSNKKQWFLLKPLYEHSHGNEKSFCFVKKLRKIS